MASSSTTIASETIWPTGLDVAAVAGEGKYLYEKKMVQAFKSFAQNFRVSGLAIPGTSANLNITITLGEAVISGFYCEIPATQIAAFASVTNHVFLKLTRDGSNKVTGAQYEVNDTGTAPADSLKIGTLTASGAAITATTHSGRTGRVFRRMPLVQTFTANSNFTVPDDVTEVSVEVLAGGGGGGGGTGGSGGDGSSNGASGSGGSRGAPGGYASDVVSVNPGSVYAITVGAGGTPGAGGAGGGLSTAGTPGSGGGTGGASSFASIVSAAGGAGGNGGSTFDTALPGTGSVGSVLRTGHGSVGGIPGSGGGGGAPFGSGDSGASGSAGSGGSVVVRY